LRLFDLKHPVWFSDHPHRGFEAISYVIKGGVRHEDFLGNEGEIGPGECQWMNAGKGIIHAEISASAEE